MTYLKSDNSHVGLRPASKKTKPRKMPKKRESKPLFEVGKEFGRRKIIGVEREERTVIVHDKLVTRRDIVYEIVCLDCGHTTKLKQYEAKRAIEDMRGCVRCKARRARPRTRNKGKTYDDLEQEMLAKTNEILAGWVRPGSDK